MAASDNNAYSFKHESAKLDSMIDTQNLDKEGLPTSGRDLDDATSQSPQAQRNGGADPYHFPDEVRTK